MVAIILAGDDDKVPVKLRKKLRPKTISVACNPLPKLSAAPFPS